MQDDEATTALMHAAMNNHTNVIHALLISGAAADMSNSEGKPAIAALGPNPKTHGLLDNGANIACQLEDGHIAFIFSGFVGVLYEV